MLSETNFYESCNVILLIMYKKISCHLDIFVRRTYCAFEVNTPAQVEYCLILSLQLALMTAQLQVYMCMHCGELVTPMW